MKNDLNDLKKLTLELMKNGTVKAQDINANLIQKIYGSKETDSEISFEETPKTHTIYNPLPQNDSEIEENEDNYLFAETIEEEEEEILKLEHKEIELIKKSLEKTKEKKGSCRRIRYFGANFIQKNKTI